MDVTIVGLRWFVGITGPLVLISYVLGIMRADPPAALWGGVSGSLRTATIPFMFVAAAGFLAAAYFLLWHWSPEQVAALHWPWAEADGRGMERVLWGYIIYLIPSALWLESTLLHLQVGAGWTQALVITILTLVTVGLLILGLLGWGAVQDGVPAAGWFVAAVVGMAIQSTLNDNIVWVWKFPW